MTTRLNFFTASPAAAKAMLDMEKYVATCGLEMPLIELVKMRASQLNGCAYCIDMHSKDARAAGETEQRLYLLSAWREAHCFSLRERAALEWTESLTLVADNHVPDAVYEAVRGHFSDEELVNLTYVVTAINSWNRFAIAFRSPVGTYEPNAVKA